MALAQIRYIIGGECIWKDEDIQRALDSGATVNEVINDILDGRFQPPPPSHSRDVSSLERMDIHVSRKIDVIEIDSDSCNSPERVIPDSPRTNRNKLPFELHDDPDEDDLLTPVWKPSNPIRPPSRTNSFHRIETHSQPDDMDDKDDMEDIHEDFELPPTQIIDDLEETASTTEVLGSSLTNLRTSSSNVMPSAPVQRFLQQRSTSYSVLSFNRSSQQSSLVRRNSDLGNSRKKQKEYEAIKKIAVQVDARLGNRRGQTIAANLRTKSMQVHVANLKIPNSVIWWHLTYENGVPSIDQQEKLIAVILPAAEAVNLYKTKKIDELTTIIKSTYPNFRVLFVIEQSNKKLPKLTEQELIVALTLQYGCGVRMTNGTSDTGELVARITRHLATKSLRNTNPFDDIYIEGSRRRAATTARDAWLQQLQTAEAIVTKFPTLRSLIDIYTDPYRSEREKAAVLSEIPMESTNSSRRIGINVSERVYRFFTSTNGNELMND